VEEVEVDVDVDEQRAGLLEDREEGRKRARFTKGSAGVIREVRGRRRRTRVVSKCMRSLWMVGRGRG
jgi:hypothetical protein